MKIISFLIIFLVATLLSSCASGPKQLKRESAIRESIKNIAKPPLQKNYLKDVNTKDGVNIKEAKTIAQYIMSKSNVASHYNLDEPKLESVNDKEIAFVFSPIDPKSENAIYRHEFLVRINKSNGAVIYSGIKK